MRTRFMQEISGDLDRQVAERTGKANNHIWQRHAEQEVARVREQYENGELIIDEYGIAYWASNANAIPEEVAEKVEYAGLPINRELTKELEDEQTARSIEAYRERMKDYEYSEEELFEMRCAFGEGATVVNVITGKRIQL